MMSNEKELDDDDEEYWIFIFLQNYFYGISAKVFPFLCILSKSSSTPFCKVAYELDFQ